MRFAASTVLGGLAMAAGPSVVAVPALAQSAILTVSHNDPDGLVAPGQTVLIAASLAWVANGQVCRIAGSLMATPDRGTAANP